MHFFRHLNFQKCSKPAVLCTFWLGNVLRATTACTFSTSQLQKLLRRWCALHILTSKCASCHNGVQLFISHLPRRLRLLFDPPEPQIIGKTLWFATLPPFCAPASSVFWLDSFSSLIFFLFSDLLLFSDSSHVCFSSVHIVGSLTSKLPSIIYPLKWVCWWSKWACLKIMGKHPNSTGLSSYCIPIWNCHGGANPTKSRPETYQVGETSPISPLYPHCIRIILTLKPVKSTISAQQHVSKNWQKNKRPTSATKGGASRASASFKGFKRNSITKLLQSMAKAWRISWAWVSPPEKVHRKILSLTVYTYIC